MFGKTSCCGRRLLPWLCANQQEDALAAQHRCSDTDREASRLPVGGVKRLPATRIGSPEGKELCFCHCLLDGEQFEVQRMDIEIPLEDVEKVKMTYKAILYQNIGVYLKDTHYVFQVKNGAEWVDAISNAVIKRKPM